MSLLLVSFFCIRCFFFIVILIWFIAVIIVKLEWLKLILEDVGKLIV